MEEHKLKYLRHVMSLTPRNFGVSPYNIFCKCRMDFERRVGKTARDCYSETIEDLDRQAFAEMMVIDGCFIIALLCKAAGLIDIDYGDPIFKIGGQMSKLQNDLLMLENQIPFIVLQCLFDAMDFLGGHDRPSLVHLALNFFQGLAPTIRTPTKEDLNINCEHLLHLFHISLLPTAKEDKPSDRIACFRLIINQINAFKESVEMFKKARNKEKDESVANLLDQMAKSQLLTAKEDKPSDRNACFRLIINRIKAFKESVGYVFKKARIKEKDDERQTNHFGPINSITVLKNAGIKFKKVKAADSFFNVKFKNGTMEIPMVRIHGTTYSVFLNLIAFEECYSNCTNHFTAYAVFMKCLINSAEDIGTLRKSGIIENSLGSDDEAADMFKRLCREVAISTNEFYLSNMFRDVHRYRRTKWDECEASLKRFYFNNPWSIVPFAAATLLLCLGIIQAFFAMYSYFFPHAS